MIPGISIIVFLKCKDSGIRDASTRFCFSDLLCLRLGARGATGGRLVGLWGSGTPQGPRDPTGAPGPYRGHTLMSPAALCWSTDRKNKPAMR